ncbi:ATP-binding cassette domain-containing protein [Sinorhizobium fredii]|uniref:ATP-binding cassette domain-containing protein n=1 Tax=Rhizobium fredii TaxID=380 RepID=UPI001FCB47DF|nr:ATP-binding cassette domain-containing protein [Sinorhizobium fredii]
MGRAAGPRRGDFLRARGQFCALLGPNGVGKSTLYGLLTRLFTPRTGAIFVAGPSPSLDRRRPKGWNVLKSKHNNAVRPRGRTAFENARRLHRHGLRAPKRQAPP